MNAVITSWVHYHLANTNQNSKHFDMIDNIIWCHNGMSGEQAARMMRKYQQYCGLNLYTIQKQQGKQTCNDIMAMDTLLQY